MHTLTIDVDGTTCGGCTGSVQNALSAVDGLSNVHVSLHPGSATMDADGARVTPEELEAVIGRARYRSKAHVGSHT